MHLITRKTIRTFWQQHPDSKTALERWSQIIKKNNYDSFTQLRATFPSADQVGTLDSSFKSGNPPNGLSRKLIVFNIGGNKYRLIAAIHFNRYKVYIRNILTHADYDKRCDPALCGAVSPTMRDKSFRTAKDARECAPRRIIGNYD